jgi:hypothetical protein
MRYTWVISSVTAWNTGASLLPLFTLWSKQKLTAAYLEYTKAEETDLLLEPVTLAERSKAWTVLTRSEVVIVGSNLN